MRDFGAIRAAALEGEVEDEPVNVTPRFDRPPRQSALEQIQEMQDASRARAHRNSILAGRYLLVCAVLMALALGLYGPPAWLRDTEFWVGALLGVRGIFCFEAAAVARRETRLDPMAFLGRPD